jgi:hypothetical protein
MNEKNEIPMLQEIYDIDTIEGITGIIEARLAERNYLEALNLSIKLEKVMSKEKITLPFGLPELINILKKLDILAATVKDSKIEEIYKTIKNHIFLIIPAVKKLEIREIERQLELLKQYNNSLINDNTILNQIKKYLEEINYAIYIEENSNAEITNNLLQKLIAKDYKLSKDLAKNLTEKNSFPFNLEKLIALYEELDVNSKNQNLNAINKEIKAKIFNIITAIAKSPNNLTILVNELEDYLTDPNKINFPDSEVKLEIIQDLFTKIINATECQGNKKTNKFLCEFLINAIHTTNYSDAFLLAHKLKADNSLSFDFLSLINILYKFTGLLPKYNNNNELQTALNKLHENIEKRIVNIIRAIENSEDIQPKIEDLKSFAENFNSKDYPIQNNQKKLINTIIVNLLIAIGCLGIGFPLALGVHYWKTGRVFFKEHTKNEKEFDIEAHQVTQKISSNLAGKKQN